VTPLPTLAGTNTATAAASPAGPSWPAVGRYLLISFGGSWFIAAAFRLLGGRLTGDLFSMAVGVPYMMVPMVAAIIVQRRVRLRPVAALGISFRLNRWWLVGWLAPLGITLAALGVSLLLPGIRFSPEMAGLFDRLRGLVPDPKLAEMRSALKLLPVHPFWLLLGQGLFAGLTVNAVAGFGEELGWRGFLLPEFGRYGFWRSSWLVGLIWGIWHAPLVLEGLNYRAHPVAGVFMMTGWCLLLSPLFSYVMVKSRSVIAVSVMHGSFNAFTGLAVIMVAGGTDLLAGVTGFAGFIVLAAANLALFAFGGGGLTAARDRG
jgi:uncharacterized protein